MEDKHIKAERENLDVFQGQDNTLLEYQSRIRNGVHSTEEFKSFIAKYEDLAKGKYPHNFATIYEDIKKHIDKIHMKYKYAYEVFCDIKEYIENGNYSLPTKLPSGSVYYPITSPLNLSRNSDKDEDFAKEINACFNYYLHIGGLKATLNPLLELYEKYAKEYKTHLQMMLHFIEDNSNIDVINKLN